MRVASPDGARGGAAHHPTTRPTGPGRTTRVAAIMLTRFISDLGLQMCRASRFSPDQRPDLRQTVLRPREVVS